MENWTHPSDREGPKFGYNPESPSRERIFLFIFLFMKHFPRELLYTEL